MKAQMNILSAKDVKIGYDDKIIVEQLSLEIETGKITTIIGPNGCGKSTILKALARLNKVKAGAVYLDGEAIQKIPTKKIAKKMAVLPQSPDAPSGLTTYDLVSYGRSPHQVGFGRLGEKDKEIIDWALEVTGLTEWKYQEVDTLSGGQRQRAWIAMAIAQETELLLLDEPTTYLDMAHQLEVLQLLKKLNEEEKRTIVMVIHDLNHASRFSDKMIAMKKGKLRKEGTPNEVMTAEVLKDVFQVDAEIVTDPRTNKPACLSYDLVDAEMRNTGVLSRG